MRQRLATRRNDDSPTSSTWKWLFFSRHDTHCPARERLVDKAAPILSQPRDRDKERSLCHLARVLGQVCNHRGDLPLHFFSRQRCQERFSRHASNHYWDVVGGARTSRQTAPGKSALP